MNVQWLFQRVKMLVKGAIVAMIIAVPCFTAHAQAPMNRVQPNYPQYFQMHHKEQRQAPMDVVIDTGTPYFFIDGTWNSNFTMTWYDVKTERGIEVSHGEKWNDKRVRIHNNDMQYYDDEYGWIQIVAVNIDQVKEYGYGNAAVVNSTMLGSVMEIEYPDGHREKAIILDVCGKARTERIVDRWVYDGRQAQNTYGRLEGIQFKFIRFGFDK